MADRFQRVRTCVRHGRAGHDPAAATQHEPLHVHQRLLAGGVYADYQRVEHVLHSDRHGQRDSRDGDPRRFRRVGDDEGLPRPCADLPRVRLLPPDQRVPVSLLGGDKDLPGVPLATEETLGQNLPRATMEQVYKRITDDLDEALRIFEEIGYDDTGSRTDFDASVAAILRARVALVMEDWGKAVSLADDILAKYTLVSKENYNSGFNRIENVPSLIFGFKMTADNCQTWATWCSQMDPYMSGYAGMWAERPIHSYLYARLNPTDVRRGWWLNKTDNPDPDAATSGYACLLPSNLPNTLASGVKARSEYV